MKNILTFCLLFIGLFTAHSQSGVKLDALTNNRTIDTCGTAFYDDGDATGNYSASQTRTITFRPNGAAAVDNSIKITISQIDLAPGAQLCFFDGTTTAAPSLGCITSANQFSRSPWVIAATRQNPSRAVTIQFTAPAGATAAGWAAFVTCDFSCQPITAQIYESTPAIMPIDTGYIDACIGQQITLKARGIYPQNGVNYTQNDTLSSFEWNLGEVNSAIVYGPVINKVYTRSGFYNIQLTIIDTTGKCRNTNFINQRVRIAPEP
ncbi:MAG: hypothetical protein RL757_1281, partial [Bacteroidota bacterium]